MMWKLKLFQSMVLGIALALAGPALTADPMEDCFSRDLEEEEAKACRDTASDAAYQVQLSWAQYNSGQAEEALEAARRAVEHFPTYEEGRIVLQQALVATGAVEEAVADYQQALAEGVEDTLALANNLAWNLYRAGHPEKALPILEKWLAVNPEPIEGLHHVAGRTNYPYALGTMAHILAALGRSEEAAEYFVRAAELGGYEWQSRYRGWLTEMGFTPGDDEEDLAKALRACVAESETCKLFPQ